MDSTWIGPLRVTPRRMSQYECAGLILLVFAVGVCLGVGVVYEHAQHTASCR